MAVGLMPLFDLTILTTTPGERWQTCVPAETGADAIQRFLRRKRWREDDTITMVHATEHVEQERLECPDGGTCHHSCKAGPCFRVMTCEPLSASGWGSRWPDEVRQAERAKGRMVGVV